MRVTVLTTDDRKEEFLATGITEGTEIIWITTEKEFKPYHDSEIFFDLLFQPDGYRIEILKELLPKPVFIHDINNAMPAGLPFIRFNGWPTFLPRKILEASCTDEKMRNTAGLAISCLNRNIEWTASIPGFISARVLAMIINEAYFAFGDEVSTKKDIDTAMKLGTNYPYGPFEWCEKIGIHNIYSLLSEMSKTNNRYEPAPLLKKEAWIPCP